MKLMALAIALAWIPVAFAFPQDKKSPDSVKISAEFDNATIGEVLDSLKAISGVPIELDEAAQKKLDLETRITFKVQDTPLTEAVQILLTGRGLAVTVVDKRKVLITVAK
jgi:hypothetical protein